MADKVIPAHILRMYAWETLQVNGQLQLINGKVPIIPLEDEPDLADSHMSYIIYGYSENNDARIPEMRRGSLVFRIKARSFGELAVITNVLTRAFEGLDIAAHRINTWKTKDEYANVFKDINFKTTEAIYVEGGYPEDSEGGPLIGVVHIVYTVVIHDGDFMLPNNAQSALWD